MRPLILLVVVVVVISATIAKGFPSLGPKGNVSTAAQNQKYTYHERRQPAGSESLSAENVNMGQKIDISGKHEFQAPIETDRYIYIYYFNTPPQKAMYVAHKYM